MKTRLTLLASLCAAFLLAGCVTTREPGKLVYRQDQFKSRLEYLRFCQHYELLAYRCPD
jgi:outer membrane biogenesis lipoprotein LolB